ncbi:hypothetical protein [Agromyces silvae]|uniref:hypothetical protein n=1 Tax=Agromyces silvae TaxID=3388266 RepID=UPI00280C38B1|nr:hypothetical protein [Agromyces protaetiae]
MGDTWKRDEPQWFRVTDLPEQVSSDLSFAAGLLGRQISRDETTGAETWLFSFAEDWKLSWTVEHGTLEFFILAGGLEASGQRLGSAGFIGAPPGTELEVTATEAGALLAYWNPDPAVGECYGGSPVILRSPDLRWISGNNESREDLLEGNGVSRKGLRPQLEGIVAGGSLGLLHFLPGYASFERETHDAWEEVFIVAGDVYFAGRGAGEPGFLACNPANYPHGPYGSHSGGLMIIQTGPMARTDYFPLEGTKESLEGFIDATPFTMAASSS